MKRFIYITLSSFWLAGCGANRNATLFIKEQDQYITNLKGDTCTESGHNIVKAPNGEYYRMITSYGNCDVQTNRKMQEFEPKQWGLPVLKKGR